MNCYNLLMHVSRQNYWMQFVFIKNRLAAPNGPLLGVQKVVKTVYTSQKLTFYVYSYFYFLLFALRVRDA